jgi:1-deoxyxylulose-5-phosphate synthase
MNYEHIAGLVMPMSRLIMGAGLAMTRDVELSHAGFDRFVALGGNAFDTAHVYGNGYAERALGAWMSLRNNRRSMLVIGKGAHPDERWTSRVSPEAISLDLSESLERLRTDYIDLYLLHRDDPAVPVDEIVACLNEHQRAGRIHAFGGSNWTTDRIAAANRYALTHHMAPFVASSPQYSLATVNEFPLPGCLAISTADRAWYVSHQFPVLAWSSQAQGFFSGRYTPDDRSNEEKARVWFSAENFARLDRAKTLGLQKEVSANTIALAYVLCQPFPTCAIIGPRSIDQLSASMDALEVQLTADEVRWLNLEN